MTSFSSWTQQLTDNIEAEHMILSDAAYFVLGRWCRSQVLHWIFHPFSLPGPISSSQQLHSAGLFSSWAVLQDGSPPTHTSWYVYLALSSWPSWWKWWEEGERSLVWLAENPSISSGQVRGLEMRMYPEATGGSAMFFLKKTTCGKRGMMLRW